MIWFFLAGFISGAVGMVMLATWWMRRHATVIRLTPDDEEDADGQKEED